MEKPKWNYELCTISKDNCPWCQLYSASFQGSTYKREEPGNNFGQDFAFIQSTISQTSSRIHNDVLFYFCPGWQSITTDFFTKHVQDFCPLKIKITQCPGGFRLNSSWYDCKIQAKKKNYIWKLSGGKQRSIMGDMPLEIFWIAIPSLSFKARLSAKPLSWKQDILSQERFCTLPCFESKCFGTG